MSPEKENANHIYKYKVGAAAETVVYGQSVKNWSLWNGEADITATSGQVITVVECDKAYKAMNAGSATVVAAS